MKRHATTAMIAALLALPAPAVLANGATDAAGYCQGAALDQLERSGYYAESQFSNPSVKRAGGDYSVTGSGRTGQAKFSFSCRYSPASRRTSHVHVKVAQQKSPSAGDVAGAIIGAAIAGAIINSVNKHSGNNNGYSGGYSSSGRVDYPEPGVECYSDQSACYRNGQFDPRYTRQWYADGE